MIGWRTPSPQGNPGSEYCVIFIFTFHSLADPPYSLFVPYHKAKNLVIESNLVINETRKLISVFTVRHVVVVR